MGWVDGKTYFHNHMNVIILYNHNGMAGIRIENILPYYLRWRKAEWLQRRGGSGFIGNLGREYIGGKLPVDANRAGKGKAGEGGCIGND